MALTETTRSLFPASGEFSPAEGWAERTRSAVGRRAKRLRDLVTGNRRPYAVEASLDWLARHDIAAGLPVSSATSKPCVAVTSAAIEAAIACGQRAWATPARDWLLAVQRPEGGFPDTAGAETHFHTGRALRALLASTSADDAFAPRLADHASARRVDDAIAAAAGFLARRVDAAGDLASSQADGAIDRWAPTSLKIVCLPPLLEASRRLHEPRWREAAERCLAFARRAHDLSRWNAPLHLTAQVIEALLDLNQTDVARAALRLTSAMQRRDGSVPALPDAAWISSAGLARLAKIWFRLGASEEMERGERALSCLARRQRPSGGFTGSWGRGARYHPRAELTETAAAFVEAAVWQVRRSFDTLRCDFPALIEETDGRALAVLNWRAHLPKTAHIADLGCGRGRFLRHLQARCPRGRLTGVDLSPSMLSGLPQGVEMREGSLLDIPAASGEFDGVLCIEALEHALLPRRAVEEICRTVRPGGSVLIIDKNHTHQGLSQHQPWERWPTAAEVSDWLAPHCQDVTVTAIAHGASRHPSGLFLCWTARKKPAAQLRAAA